jgi:ubiquinone/menaquinone biosynthesis C-methylase UbiE
MDRGFLGTLPLADERDDDSYLDFVEGVRTFTLTQLSPVVKERTPSAIAEYEARAGHKTETIDDARAALDPVPVIATRNRFMRSSQEMMWRRIAEVYHRREAELLAELDRYDRMGPGTVEWDPNFVYPDYYAKVEFHIQPGNYHADPLAGYIYHYGTKIFYTGRNNQDGVQREWVNLAPVPADGVVRRVMDQACSAGQSTTALKERFPQAEVWGIDIAAPMVRYAHKRAVDMGIEVHFAQRAAEDTKFPENFFDIVYSRILFHELPPEIAEQVVRESYRILRPGGLFIVIDFANRPPGITSPADDYFRDFDTHHNGEPYASLFVYSDFTGMLRRAGFRNVIENYTPQMYQPMRVCEK